jgi:hypothetical protein
VLSPAERAAAERARARAWEAQRRALEAWDKGRGAAHAELLMQRGAARLALGEAAGAAHDFRRARWVWRRALRGPSHAREADEDHAQAPPPPPPLSY